MNKVYSFLIILFCFSDLFAIELVNQSSYSLLFESKSIRTDIVNKALINLPKKEFVDLLMMNLKMIEAKDSYNLTSAESAYLLYKWIGQNIEVNYKDGNNDYMNVYNFRKGTPSGISNLFIMMCNYCDIKSKPISGYVKGILNKKDGKISKIESTWNYIVIDSLKYLVDASLGAGYYTEDEFEKFNSDLFFGTKPEIFINYHYPKDITWQMLPQAISPEKFDSLPLISNEFYLYGFKSFYPDYFDIKKSKTIKIELTYDNSIEIESFYRLLYNETYTSHLEKVETVKSNGKYEITLKESRSTVLYLGIFIGENNIAHAPYIILYRLIP